METESMRKNQNFIIRGNGYSNYEIIDYLKGFSILTIVLMHYFQQGIFPAIVEKALSIGGSGVHIFFFCSGFGLFVSYSKRHMGYFEFLKRRFLKIYIPYIIIVLISVCLPFFVTTNSVKTFMAHALLYKMFIPLYEETAGPFWFLSTLFQFYFIFIPIMKVKGKIGTSKMLICGCVLSAFWWIFTALTGLSQERIWGSFFIQYLWEFVIGIAIAERLIQRKNIEIRKWILYVSAVLGIGLAGFAKIIGGPLTAINDIFAVCGYGSIALLLFLYGGKLYRFIIIEISGMSYELYLVHMLVFVVLHQLFANLLICALVSLPCAFIVAIYYKKIISFLLKNEKGRSLKII